MTEVTGGAEEHAWNFEHRGDDVKIVASAATTLASKVRELFAADGVIAQVVEKAKARGPVDYPKRRTRYVRITNGDVEGDARIVPLLIANLVLLLIVAVGVGVGLYQLSNIEQGLTDGRTTRTR